MKKDYRIKNSKEFALVFNDGKSFANRQFVLYVLPNKEDNFRLGLSVSKKIGNAVTRNRVKRLIREVFHQLQDDLKRNDYVVIARKPVSEMDFEQTKKSLIHVMRQARVLQRRTNDNNRNFNS